MLSTEINNVRRALDDLQEALDAIEPPLRLDIREALRFNTETVQALLAAGRPGVPTTTDIARAYNVLARRLQGEKVPVKSVKNVLKPNNRVHIAAQIILGIEREIDFVNAEQAVSTLRELQQAVLLPPDLLTKTQLLINVLEPTDETTTHSTST